MKNGTEIVEPAVKVEKSNYNRLLGRSKGIDIKYVLFRNFGNRFQVCC